MIHCISDFLHHLFGGSHSGHCGHDDVANALAHEGVDLSQLSPEQLSELAKSLHFGLGDAHATVHGESAPTTAHPGDLAHAAVRFGGYYNADGTYHYTSDNTDRDVQTGAIVRRW